MDLSRLKRWYLLCVLPLFALALPSAHAQEVSPSQVEEEAIYLSLGRCIEMALKHPPNLALAQYQKSSASADKLAGWGGLLPTVSLGGNFNRSWGTSYGTLGFGGFGDFGDLFDFGGGVQNMYRFDATVTVPLISPLSWFSLLASRASYKAAELGYEIEREKLAVEVSRAYFAILQAEKMLSSAEYVHQAASRHLDLAEKMYELGGVSQIDVLTAQTAEANAMLILISARNAFEVTKMNLCYFIGLPVDSSVTLQDVVDFPLETLEYEECLQCALMNRKEILSVEKELAAADYSKWASISGKLPHLSGVSSYYWSDDTLDFGDWGDKDGYSIGVQISLNLFDGLSTESAIARARAAKKLAEIKKQQSDENISLEVRSAYLSAQEASERMVVAKRAMVQASLELELAERRYELEAGSIIELTDAQATYSKANGDYISAVYDYQMSAIELERAVGTLSLP